MERYHTFWRRFWAGVLDSVILTPFTWLDNEIQSAQLSTGLSISWLFVSYFFFSAYIVLMHARFGQTIGKMLTGVTVLSVDAEDRISLRQAVLREIPYILMLLVGWLLISFTLLKGIDRIEVFFFEAFLGFASIMWFALEIFSMLLNEKRRAIHDFIAGTVVVRDA